MDSVAEKGIYHNLIIQDIVFMKYLTKKQNKQQFIFVLTSLF
jgi:hypothetical protein